MLLHRSSKWLRLGTAALTFVISSLGLSRGEEAKAPPKHPDLPLLWKIEGGKLKKPSYLFGTVHLGKSAVGNLHPLAAKAFADADALHTEIPFSSGAMLATSLKMIRKDGKSLSDSIGPEATKRLEAELKNINPNLDLTPFNSFRTWAVAVTLPLLPYQLKGEKSLDNELWIQARQDRKITQSLEKIDDQLGVFEQFTEPEQVRLLISTLDQLEADRKEGTNQTETLVQAYLSGDPDQILKTLHGGREKITNPEDLKLYDRLMKSMLDDRNAKMARKITEILASQPDRTHFFAVGTAHYVGPKSVQSFLSSHGYRFTLVRE